MQSFDYQVQRVDFRLRNEFLGLETEIYEVDHRAYVIVCLSSLEYFDEMVKTFDYSIRPAAEAIALSTYVPEKYNKKIPSIPNPVSGFRGFPLTIMQLRTILESKFHALKFEGLYVDYTYHELIIEVVDDAEQKQGMLHELREFTQTVTPFSNIIIRFVLENYREKIVEISKSFVFIKSVRADRTGSHYKIITVHASPQELYNFHHALKLKWGKYTFEVPLC